ELVHAVACGPGPPNRGTRRVVPARHGLERRDVRGGAGMLQRLHDELRSAICRGLREAPDDRDTRSHTAVWLFGWVLRGERSGCPSEATLAVMAARIRLAGFPAHTSFGGTLPVTTEAAPMTAPRPMVTPLRIVACAPMKASSSIFTGSVATCLPNAVVEC